MARKPKFVPPYKYERETKAAYAERTEFLRKLHTALKPGDKITTVIRHVSSSGMSRSIDAYLFTCGKDGIERQWLSYWIAHSGIGTWDSRRDAVKMGGVGMDMGFALVYELSSMLYPNGFQCLGKANYPELVQKWLNGEGKRPNQPCPSNDHVNGLREYGPHIHHDSGGYALLQEWLG